MSKASPTIFLDKHDDVVGVFGAAGGFFIPTALIQVGGISVTLLFLAVKINNKFDCQLDKF